VTTGPGTGRVSTSETVRGLLAALAARDPRTLEGYSVTIGTTAKHGSAADPDPKRLHTWEIVARGGNPDETTRIALRLDDGLAAKYAHELDTTDNLASALANSTAGRKP
jgi:hypothetical protein